MEGLEASSSDDVMSPGFEAVIRVLILYTSFTFKFNESSRLRVATLDFSIRSVTFTFAFGLYLEKRLQTATFSPAVFRAVILASMFDTLKGGAEF